MQAVSGRGHRNHVSCCELHETREGEEEGREEIQASIRFRDSGRESSIKRQDRSPSRAGPMEREICVLHCLLWVCFLCSPPALSPKVKRVRSLHAMRAPPNACGAKKSSLWIR